VELERVYSNRVRPLANRAKEEGLDALWVSSLVNIRYLTGFTGSFAQLFISPK
jgi:Xaa-Pro aminopeptidase